MRKLIRMIAVGTLAVAMLAGTAPASHALVETGPASHGECVSAEVYTEDSNGNKSYIIGPKKCIVDTHWPVLIDGGDETGTSLIRVGVWVWIPVPPPPPPPPS